MKPERGKTFVFNDAIRQYINSITSNYTRYEGTLFVRTPIGNATIYFENPQTVFTLFIQYEPTVDLSQCPEGTNRHSGKYNFHSGSSTDLAIEEAKTHIEKMFNI